MKVREMSPDERPREKAKREGLSALSNRELIALLLQSGTKSKSVLELADEVLSLCGSLGELMYMDPNDLMEINGIKEVRAIQLFAGIELCRRIDRSSLEKVAICSPDDLCDGCGSAMAMRSRSTSSRCISTSKTRSCIIGCCSSAR